MITSMPLVRTLMIASLLGSLAPAATLRAADPTTVTVDFSPPVQVEAPALWQGGGRGTAGEDRGGGGQRL